MGKIFSGNHLKSDFKDYFRLQFILIKNNFYRNSSPWATIQDQKTMALFTLTELRDIAVSLFGAACHNF